MGLLDINMNTPEGEGFNSALMAAAQSLLTPRAQGGGMGAAFGAFPKAIEHAQLQSQRARMLGLQEKQMGQQGQRMDFDMDQARRKTLAEQVAAQNRAAFLEAFHQNGGKITSDMMPKALAGGIKPEDLKDLANFKNWGRTKLEFHNGVGVDPYEGKPIAAVPDVNKPFTPTIGSSGAVSGTPNEPYQAFAARTAKAGAPSVEVKVDNKMGESVGAQVGPILKSSRDKTEGALSLGDSAERIIGAIDAGGVIAGPGATLRVLGAQAADLIGVGGKDNAAKLENTRRVIRGLAESGVEARKELAGQGQVTENEAKAVEKAKSGNIEELTVSEIRLIAGLNVKAARMRAKQHQTMLDRIPAEMKSAAPFYQIPGMEKWTAGEDQPTVDQPTSGAAKGWSVKKVK